MNKRMQSRSTGPNRFSQISSVVQMLLDGLTVAVAFQLSYPLWAISPFRRRPDIIAPEEITAPAIAALDPEVVLTPLVGAGFDCLDVALALCAAGYRGRLRAVVRYVPNPALVRREIAASCPGLDFDLIVIGPPRAAPPAPGQ